MTANGTSRGAGGTATDGGAGGGRFDPVTDSLPGAADSEHIRLEAVVQVQSASRSSRVGVAQEATCPA